MRPTDITAALASEHRIQLLHEAKQYRLARCAAAARADHQMPRDRRTWAARWRPSLVRPVC